MRKKKILLIVPPERVDFYSYLAQAENTEWVLLWHESASEMKMDLRQLPLRFSEIFFWNRFITPVTLLRKVRPDRIIFFEIIDLRQIALNVAARRMRIPTFYLEHGAAGDRDSAVSRWTEVTFSSHKLPYFLKRLSSSFLNILKSKVFYFSVFRGFDSRSSYLKYLLLPFKMLAGSPNRVLSMNHFRERVPWRSIVFNHVNFDEFVLYTGIKTNEAIFTGVPFFDKYFSRSGKEQDYIVYIDHPYLESGICGWTDEHHAFIGNKLVAFAVKHRTRLFIKLHPRSSRTRWVDYIKESGYVVLLEQGDFTDIYLNAKLILGFSSSLVTGFLCARKNVVLLGWHPVPHIFGSDFSKTGLCHHSFSPEDLSANYDFWIRNNLTYARDDLYQNFIRKYNQPWDGEATRRVIDAIVKDEVS